MSHRALIAERQRNDRFNIYHSRNGAERIQLLDELRESLNVHGRVDWESLNGTTTPEMAQRMNSAEGSKYTVKSGDTGNVVEPRPLAVDVREEDLLRVDGLLSYEVLYVVDDGTVDAYWLAWAYPDVIRPWHDHLEVEVYNSGSVPDDPNEMVTFFEDREPVRTISEFEQGWLTDDRVRDIVQRHHRWLYEMQSMTLEEIDDAGEVDIEEVPQSLQTPEHYLVFRSDTTERLLSSSLPFIIPIRVGSPPNLSSKRISEAASQTRFSIGAGLNAVDEPCEDELRQSYADAMMEIVDAHVDRVAAEFIPGELGEVIEAYQQTHDWSGLRAVWKN
jgi:hypothetical protein